MKLHSAWLAGALLVFAVLGCHFSTNSNSTSGAISEIHMAKDDGSGALGDKTNTFSPTDRKVHCVLTLRNPKEGTQIKYVWWIVDAGGVKNQILKEIDYTTGANEAVVPGYLSRESPWPTGKYKCEAYVNGVLEKTVEFWVR